MRMSPENQERAKARTNEILAELAIQDLCRALSLTREQLLKAMQTNQIAKP